MSREISRSRAGRQQCAIIALGLVLASCSPTATNSDGLRAPTGPVRDQGTQGACWIYSYLTMLNALIKRDTYYGKQAFDANLDEIYQNVFATGEFTDFNAIESSMNDEKLISIAGSLYQYYLYTHRHWLTADKKQAAPWYPANENQIPFDAEGGDPMLFNRMYKSNFFLTTHEVPDSDFAVGSPANYSTVLNDSGITLEDSEAYVNFIAENLETKAAVPEPLRVRVDEQGAFQSPVLAMTRNISSEFSLPAEIKMTYINTNNTNDVYGIEFFKTWPLPQYPSRETMAELAAVLTALNYPLGLTLVNWGVNENHHITVGDIEAHAVTFNDYRIENQAITLVAQNSWGVGSHENGHLYLSDFNQKEFLLVGPAHMYARVNAGIKEAAEGICPTTFDSRLALAAYASIADRLGPNASPVGVMMSKAFKTCGGHRLMAAESTDEFCGECGRFDASAGQCVTDPAQPACTCAEGMGAKEVRPGISQCGKLDACGDFGTAMANKKFSCNFGTTCNIRRAPGASASNPKIASISSANGFLQVLRCVENMPTHPTWACVRVNDQIDGWFWIGAQKCDSLPAL